MNQIHFTLLKQLNYDVLMKIVLFVEPHDIKRLCEFSFEADKIITDLFAKNLHFNIPCKMYIVDDVVDWFNIKNFRLDLLMEIKINHNWGMTLYFRNNELHRDDDLPAVIWLSGRKEWYQNGELHRKNDQPAVYVDDFYKAWYCRHKLHRNHDQPAIVHGKCEEWYEHGLKHREGDKPAVINKNQFMLWYKNGELFRDNNQPTTLYCNEYNEWYEPGKNII